MKKVIPHLFLVLLLFISYFVSSDSFERSTTEPPTRDFWIKGDAALLQTATISGWPGNGTEENPIIIRDRVYTIEPYQGISLKIEDISLSFKIINVTLKNYSFSEPGGIQLINASGDIIDCNIKGADYGIRLTDVSYMKVSGGNYSGGGFGIVVERCNNVSIESNFCYNNTDGISVLMSDNCQVMENELIGNSATGASADDSSNIIFLGNRIEDNDFGIYVLNSVDVNIHNNTLTNQDDHHVRIDASKQVMVNENEMIEYGDGLHITAFTNNVTAINNSLINNGEYGIYINDDCLDNSFHENSMVNCSFYIEPRIENIRRQEISLNNTVNGGGVYHLYDLTGTTVNISNDAGQVILGAVDHANVNNCELNNGTVGMEIVDCGSVRITGCELSGNFYYGLFGGGNENVLVEFSEISDNLEGVFLSPNFDFHLIGNTVSNNEVGIHIIGTNSYKRIIENRIAGNVIGIRLEGSSSTQSDLQDNISYNDFLENREIGLSLTVDNISVYNNEFNWNPIGIESENSRNEIVDFNIFSGCGLGIKTDSRESVYKYNIFQSGRKGISIGGSFSKDCRIYENLIAGMEENGIMVKSSMDLEISGNKIMDSGSHGIELFRSESVTLNGNDLINCSVHISGYKLAHFNKIYVEDNNTINYRPLLLLNSMNGGQIDLREIIGELIIIDSYDIAIKDRFFESGSVSIQAAYCRNMSFNNISYHKYAELFECEKVVINGSLITDSMRIISCKRSTISDCVLRDSYENCLDIRGSTSITIKDCYVEEATTGIRLQTSQYCSIQGNYFNENYVCVSLIGASSDNTIERNVFYRSKGYAVDIAKSCQENTIIHNAFKFNNGSWLWSEPSDHYQIRCEDQQNYIGSNWWGAYTTFDDIGDGYLDDPIRIEGRSGLMDRNPLTNIPDGIIPKPVLINGEVRGNESSLQMEWYLSETFPGLSEDHFFLRWSVDGDTAREYDTRYPGDGSLKTRFYPYDVEKRNDISIQVRIFGGLSYPFNYNWAPPIEKPMIEFIEPEEGQMFNHSDIWIKWKVYSSVADNFTHLISLNGVDYQNIGRGIEEEYDGSHTDGWHKYWVKVYDEYGNWAMKNISYFVDRESPKVRITSPKDGSLNQGFITLTWNLSDDTSGIRSVWMKINGEFYKDLHPNQRMEYLQLDSGEYTIIICTWDMLYNFNSARLKITIDSVPPVVYHNFFFSEDVSAKHILHFYFNEDVDRSTLDFKIDGVTGDLSWNDDRNLVFMISEDLDFDATYPFTLIISDSAGNVVNYSNAFRTPQEPIYAGTISFYLEGPGISDQHSVSIYIDGDLVKTVFLPIGVTLEDIEPGNHILRIEVEGANDFKTEFELEPSGFLDLGTITLEKEETGGSSLSIIILIFGLIIGMVMIALFIIVRGRGEHPEE